VTKDSMAERSWSLLAKLAPRNGGVWKPHVPRLIAALRLQKFLLTVSRWTPRSIQWEC